MKKAYEKAIRPEYEKREKADKGKGQVRDERKKKGK